MRSDSMEDQQRLKNDIQKFLFNHGCEKTYFHCEQVGDYAFTLGKEYLDIPEKARVAGYLHDISAIYPNSQRVHIACQYGISLTKEEIEFPMIIHQKISKCIAMNEFGIEDEAILSAIECHTTLKKNYSSLDLVVFVADKIMWDQEGVPPYLEGLLSELEHSLEKAVFYYISFLLNHDIKVVHPWLWDAYKQLKSKLN